MSHKTPISTGIDFDRDGVQHGFLHLPHSHDGSAWGAVMIPITVLRNGDGPTALLTGANHGDEYEGPISLFKLANSLEAKAITGRVIIVPAMNYPAFRGGKRTSPIDGANMNRIFPGRADGTVSEKIADYFQNVLLPMADFVLDIHAGGKTLDFVPFAAAHVLPDKDQEEACMAAMRAFGAPYSMAMLEMDAVGMYDTAAEEMGKVFVSTELGGGGTATARSVEIADTGVRNFLAHAEILRDEVKWRPSKQLDMPGSDCFIIAEGSGLLEPCVDLGQPVKAGQVIARMHDVERTGVAPREYRSAMDGILASRHFPGLVNMGDCVAVIAVEVHV